MTDEEYHKFVEQASLLIERGYVTGIPLEELVQMLINKIVPKSDMRL